MSHTETLRKQHKEIESLATSLEKQLKPKLDANQADAARSTLSSLSAVIGIHLAMEDRVMYPKLRTHPDGRIATLSNRFATEMEGIKKVFEAYKARWGTAKSIEQAASTFAAESRDILKALRGRIAKEDHDLYPLVDAQRL